MQIDIMQSFTDETRTAPWKAPFLTVVMDPGGEPLPGPSCQAYFTSIIFFVVENS